VAVQEGWCGLGEVMLSLDSVLKALGSLVAIGSLVAVEGAIWRNYSLSEMLLPCGILLGIGAVTFVVGAKAFRWTES
jgi:hypothetical protein